MTIGLATMLVGAALAMWIAVAYALTRRAEARVLPPVSISWFALGAALCLAITAIVVRPLPQAAMCGAACIGLTFAADADARTGYLFDAITLPCAGLVFAVALFTGTALWALLGAGLLVGVFGAAIGISRGRAMGWGDIKAMASIGAAFGPPQSVLAIAIACTSGVLEALVRGRCQPGAEIRFGPHLAAGAAIALVAGDPLVHYLAGA